MIPTIAGTVKPMALRTNSDSTKLTLAKSDMPNSMYKPI
ncbi:hypothetical protein protein [Bacillus cereus G9241]|nr:hypothetical protein protein [Bacillus cereus G9241]